MGAGLRAPQQRRAAPRAACAARFPAAVQAVGGDSMALRTAGRRARRTRKRRARVCPRWFACTRKGGNRAALAAVGRGACRAVQHRIQCDLGSHPASFPVLLRVEYKRHLPHFQRQVPLLRCCCQGKTTAMQPPPMQPPPMGTTTARIQLLPKAAGGSCR